MFVVNGYSSLNNKVHDADFKKESNSSRRYYRKFLVHIKLSKSKETK